MFEQAGSIVTFEVDGEFKQAYFLPYWIERVDECGDGDNVVAEMHLLGHLPKHIKEAIKQLREE